MDLRDPATFACGTCAPSDAGQRPIRRKRIDRELLRDHAAHVSELARRLASCTPHKPFTRPSLDLMLQDLHRAVIRLGEAAYADVPTEIAAKYGTDQRATSLVNYLTTDEDTPEDRCPPAPDDPQPDPAPHARFVKRRETAKAEGGRTANRRKHRT